MTATIGTALVSTATLHLQRYGVAYCTAAMVDDTTLPVGSSQPLTIGSLSHAGTVIASADFGGQARTHWVAGVGGVDANGIGTSAWGLQLPARPYHDDGGIMLSVVLADLERDAATAAGATPLGTVLEVPDVRLDVAGSWIRPAAMGRDLLDALAVAAGQPAGTWWVAPDGSTHLGPRPASSVTLSDLTVDPFDAALLWGVVRSGTDNFGALLPGVTLAAPGLPASLLIASLTVHIEGDDASAEVWGDFGQAEYLARLIRHVMAPAVAYLGARPYTVQTVAGDGRVAVSAPPGASFPDAPLLGHAPGIPGASYTMAPGAAVLVVCVGGSPGAPVCVAYPPGVTPSGMAIDVTPVQPYTSPWSVAPPFGKITLGGASPLPLVVALTQAWFTQAQAAFSQIAGYVNGIAPGTVTVPAAPLPTVADKAQASHL